jgi:hypothetical protein
MRAKDHDEMRRVFLEEPSKLFTSDIQSAFMYLSSGRKESEIAYLNRNDRDTAVDTFTGYYTRPDNDNRKKTLLNPFIIKDLNLKLIIPKLVE